MADEKDLELTPETKKTRYWTPNPQGSELMSLKNDKAWLVKDEERQEINGRLLRETLETYRLPRVTSDEELADRLGQYFTRCAENNIRPTVEEMALATGYAPRTVWNWENGIRRGPGPQAGEIVKKAKGFIQVFDAKLVMEGALNPVTYIFRAKNYYGMKDQQDISVAPTSSEADRPIEEINERYANAIELIDEE